MNERERLLVNFWFAHPIGHALEALRYCLGYKAADPQLSVSVLLNGATPFELGRLCPFIDEVYPVKFTSFTDVPSDPLDALAGVPREWDWLAEDQRGSQPGMQIFAGLAAFYAAGHEHFRPSHAAGFAGDEPPAYEPHQKLELTPPPESRAAAGRTIPDGRLAISVVLAGSSERHLYPSAASWELVLREVSRRFPDAVICLIGKHRRDDRTASSVGRAEVERLIAAIPAAVDCFDRPLLEQLALLERSALLISPHTGFSFLASTVGTPWLAISGGNWHEYFFNGEPFHSVIPDPDRYPSFAWAGLGDKPLEVVADDEGDGPRTPSMSAARIREDLPELLAAATRLIERRISYENALRDYFPRLLAAYHGDRSKIFSFDQIHRDYLTG